MNSYFGIFYTGSSSDIWNDTSDDVHLKYRDNDCTLDYMQYGSGAKVNGHPADNTSNSNWMQNTAIIPAPLEMQYLFRDPKTALMTIMTTMTSPTPQSR
jgi:hypothetical protein